MRLFPILFFGCSTSGSAILNPEKNSTVGTDTASDLVTDSGESTDEPIEETEDTSESEPESENDPELVDNDNDGFMTPEDCNDEDDTINPGAAELCDGVDNNCDNQIDEGDVCPCPYGTFNDKDYYFCNNETPKWTRARNTCENLDTILVTIDDEAENIWLTERINAIDPEASWWLGLNDRGQGNEDNFSWESGAPLAYTNWSEGEPNNWENQEDCTILYADGLWNDTSCQNRYFFICESN